MGSHGIPMSEATDPANQFAYTTGRVTDFAEKQRQDDIDLYKKQNAQANMNGVTFPVRRRS